MGFPDYHAVLFDLDGTLVRTFIDFAAMREDLRHLAREHHQDDAIEGTDDILDIASILRKRGGEALYSEAMRLLIKREEEGCSNPEKLEGATELLRFLRNERGVRIAIITRNCRAVSEKLLDRMDLAHDVLIAREDTIEFKPHPEPILKACRGFAVMPAETIMVGDLWADIASGVAAGVGATIGIRWHYLPVDRFDRCPPDYLVESLLDVHRLLAGDISAKEASD